MSRLVIPASKSNGQFSSAEGQSGDGYVERLIKYIPIEIMSLYIFFDRMVHNYFHIDSAETALTTANQVGLLCAVAIFIFGIIFTPLYLYKWKIPGHPWKMNAIISTAAFVAWSYSIGGSLFVILGIYNVTFAACVAPLFTFIAPFFAPSPVR